jgi:class 3 adenylate cyclase
MPRELVTRALGLRALVLVMWEDEIVAAAVDVESLAEDLERHRGALDVPTRPAGTPRRRPFGLARFRGLPEREVERAALLFVDLDARTRTDEARERGGLSSYLKETLTFARYAFT